MAEQMVRWDPFHEISAHLAWQDETEPGKFDIYCDAFYYPSGWYDQFSLRQRLGLTENLYHPAVHGALMVWTHGDGPEYEVMWLFHGYPGGRAEDRGRPGPGQLRATPNPFRTRTAITLAPDADPRTGLDIYDASGRLVSRLRPGPAHLTWDGTDSRGAMLPAGVYVIRSGPDLVRVVKH